MLECKDYTWVELFQELGINKNYWTNLNKRELWMEWFENFCVFEVYTSKRKLYVKIKEIYKPYEPFKITNSTYTKDYKRTKYKKAIIDEVHKNPLQNVNSLYIKTKKNNKDVQSFNHAEKTGKNYIRDLTKDSSFIDCHTRYWAQQIGEDYYRVVPDQEKIIKDIFKYYYSEASDEELKLTGDFEAGFIDEKEYKEKLVKNKRAVYSNAMEEIVARLGFYPEKISEM